MSDKTNFAPDEKNRCEMCVKTQSGEIKQSS